MKLYTCFACLAAGASAVIARPIDTFDSKEGIGVDTGQIIGLPPSVQPPTGSIDLEATADGTLRIDYSVAERAYYGGVALGRAWNESRGCGNAAGVELTYRVLEPQSRPGVAKLSLVLVDGSDCAGAACATWPGITNEIYLFFTLGTDLDDASGEWRAIRRGLCGDLSPRSPFVRVPGWGAQGNGVLDGDSITGYWIGFRSFDRGEFTTGTIEVASLRCVESPDEPFDSCDAAPRSASLVEGARLAPAAAYSTDVGGYQTCEEYCAADARCVYYATDSRFNAVTSQFPSCHLFAELRAQDLEPAAAGLDEAFFVHDPAKRGVLCDVCACSGSTADCSGRNLATVPAASEFPATTLDLSDNPRLVLIGPRAFDGLDALERLTLPVGLAHISPEALRALPEGVDVSVEPGPREPGSFLFSTADAFEDKCCGLGDSVGGITFCNPVPDVPGVVDAEFKKMELDVFHELFDPLPPLMTITPDSPFLSEAAESASKCAAYCDFNEACQAFSGEILDPARPADSPYAKLCQHWASAPSNFAEAPTAPEDAELSRMTGLPPRTRARNARVVATPKVVELSKANGYTSTFDLRLGANPLRGGVRVTPRLDVVKENMQFTFDPPRVALYNADTIVTVTVAATNVERTVTPTVILDTDACDAAFVEETETLKLDVRTEDGSNNSSNKHKRRARQGVLAAIVISIAVGCLGLAWLALAARRYARRKEKLETERAALVQEQVLAAQTCVSEFQSHFHVLKGPDFVELTKLVPHEYLRDRLLVFDSVADVRAAMAAGDVFVFISHQWLGWSEPDPDGVHLAAMKQAVQSVVATGVPLERVRVWVDVASIPQANRAAQKMAISSLPCFASTSNFFVVVSPDVVHKDTGCLCNSRTYRSRAWCRAEIMSCWARNGTEGMFVSTNQGLRPLAANDAILLEALDVFHGELTCCRRGHPNADPCDLEALVLPMLGLYAEIFRDRHGVAAEAYSVLEPVKDQFYPKTFTYRCGHGAAEVAEEHVLFGDLIAAVEFAVAMDEADPDAAVRRLPDFGPGTNGQRRHKHLHALRTLDTKRTDVSITRTLRLQRSVSNDEHRSGPVRRSTSVASTRTKSMRRPGWLARGRSSWRASAPRIPADDAGDGHA